MHPMCKKFYDVNFDGPVPEDLLDTVASAVSSLRLAYSRVATGYLANPDDDQLKDLLLKSGEVFFSCQALYAALRKARQRTHEIPETPEPMVKAEKAEKVIL